jgi:4-amino-4-deoxy-L-arabinose transferase-like glycosyltransferase
MNKKHILLWAIIALIFLPLLFFPISSDLSIFTLGGKTIAEGGDIYVDYVDLKPPLIYYLFSLFYSIFGSSEVTLRLCDYLIQIAAVVLLWRIVKKVSLSDFFAYASSIIFAVLYTSLNYTQTFQSESLTILPILGIFYIQVFNKSGLVFMLARGALIGFLAGIKPDLGIVLLAVMVDDAILKKYTFKVQFLRFLYTSAGFVLFILISILPIMNSEQMKQFGNVFQFLSFYSSQPPFDKAFVIHSIKEVANFFGDYLSLSQFALVVLGLGIYFKKQYNNDSSEDHLLRFSLLTILFMMFTIALERKFHTYHFIRMFIPLALFAAYGFKSFYGSLKTAWENGDSFKKWGIAMLLGTAIVFSPISRLVNISTIGYKFFTDQSSYDAQFEKKEFWSNMHRVQHKEITGFIKSKRAPGDMLMVVSTGAGALNFFLKDMQIARLSQSCFYLGPGAVEGWTKMAFDDLKQADWVVAQLDDIHPSLTSTDLPSWELFKQNMSMYNYLINNFHLVKTTHSFKIFQRNK